MLHLCSTECCRVAKTAAGLFVDTKRRRFKFREVRQRFRLTPIERRVAVFIVAAFMLGLMTKCYRDAHASITAGQAHSGRTIRSMSKSKEAYQTRALNYDEAASRTRKSAEKLDLSGSGTKQEHRQK